MPTIVSRRERRVPAARTAPNDEPYSTRRRSSRCHQTRCGMWWTSGCAPVASDVRQTGVSEGKVVTARRYEPASASADSVGAERSPTAFSKVDGVRPSMTIRIALLLRKRAEPGVLLACALARAQPDDGDRDRLDEADDRDEGEREREDGSCDENRRRASGRAAAPYRAARERPRAEAAERTGDGACNACLPVEDEPTDQPAADERDCGGKDGRASRAREYSRRRETESNADSRRNADQPELVHEVRSVVSATGEPGRTTRWTRPRSPCSFSSRARPQARRAAWRASSLTSSARSATGCASGAWTPTSIRACSRSSPSRTSRRSCS